MLAAVAYYLAVPLLYLLSLLPLRALFLLADLIYLILFYVARYRRKVVFQNLRNAFPEKSEAEIRSIAHRFYRHLADLIVEVVKLVTISERALRRRVTIPNVEIAETFAREQRSFLLVLGHYGNWEMFALAGCLHHTLPFYGIYRPLKDKRVDSFITRVRTRFGTRLVTMKETLRTLVTNRGQTTITAFIADQAPPPDSALWTTFLNQDTPFFVGPEKIARKFNYPVVYMWITRPRRGYYSLELEVMEDAPADTEEGAITIGHVRRLEQQIQNRPELWMWSHRRWKHKRPEGQPLYPRP